MSIELFAHLIKKPFSAFGVYHSFFDVHLDTLIYTWIGMAILFLGACVIRLMLVRSPFSLFSSIVELSFDFFSDLTRESIGFFNFNFFAFCSTLFLFTFVCNTVGLLPFCDESTKDLNTTLALALTSFFYVQYNHIKHAGFIGYLKDFTKPAIFVTPLEVISKVASIVSMSFRLFGNILGGSIVYMIMVYALGAYKEYFMAYSFFILACYVVLKNCIDFSQYYVLRILFNILLSGVFFLAAMQMFFGLFEGTVQAFVLTMLTMTYLAVALGHEPTQNANHSIEGATS